MFTREKHEQGLKNAREKEREAITAELRSYGLDVTDRNALTNIRAFIANPQGYIRTWLRHYNIPANQIYDTGTPAPPATPTAPAKTYTRPEPDLQAEDGTPAYSARAMDAFFDVIMSQVDDTLKKRLDPLEKDHQARETQALRAQVNDEAAREIAFARENWPAFEDVRVRTLALMQEDGRRTFASAYALALKEHFPKLQQLTREAVLKEIKQTPVALTDIAPTTPTRASAGKRKSGLDVESAVAQAFAKVSART